MANESLIKAAQRMYSAKATQTDITPITSAVSKGIAGITKAVAEKRAEQEERTSKPFDSFNEVVIKDDAARANFTNELESMQDALYKATVKAEGVFVSKDEKQKARDEITNIQNRIRAYKEDFNAIDLAYVQPSEYSDFNSLGEIVDNTAIKDVELAKRLIYKDDGVYAMDHQGKEERLSKFTTLSQVNLDGFATLAAERDKVIKKAKDGYSWTDVSQSLAVELNTLMTDDNWGSILFDNVVGQNYTNMPIKEGVGYDWATQEMKARGITDREKFKEMVKNGVDKNKEPFDWKKEFISDTMAAFKYDFDNKVQESLALEALKNGEENKQRDTTFLAGQYVPNVDLLNNFTAILNLKNKPGRTNATIIAGLPSLGRVWYDDKAKMYVYEDVESSGLSSSEETYKKSMTTDIKQLLSSKTGGISNKFFTQSESNDPFNPNN